MQWYSTEFQTWTRQTKHPITGAVVRLNAVRIGDQFSACIDENPIGSTHATCDAALMAAQDWLKTEAQHQRGLRRARRLRNAAVITVMMVCAFWSLRTGDGTVDPAAPSAGAVFGMQTSLLSHLSPTSQGETGLSRIVRLNAANILTQPARAATPSVASPQLDPAPDLSKEIQSSVNRRVKSVRHDAPSDIAPPERSTRPARQFQERRQGRPVGQAQRITRSKSVALKRARVRSAATRRVRRRGRAAKRYVRVVVGRRRCRIRGKSEWCRIYRKVRRRSLARLARHRQRRRRIRTARRYSYNGPVKRSGGFYWRRCRIDGKSEWCRIRR